MWMGKLTWVQFQTQAVFEEIRYVWFTEFSVGFSALLLYELFPIYQELMSLYIIDPLHMISFPVNSYSASHNNWCTVGGNGGCRVGEVRAGTTFPMPDHKGFKLQQRYMRLVMVGHGGSRTSSYLTNPTSPILSHCAVIILFKSIPSHQLSWLTL